jgi:hypothetical protein
VRPKTLDEEIACVFQEIAVPNLLEKKTEI